MLVQLEYFVPTGKWYESGSYETTEPFLHRIWDEVAHMRDEGRLPGLIEGAGKDYFQILINVPDHEHAHPFLLVPACLTTAYRRVGALEEELREAKWALEECQFNKAEQEGR